MAEITRVVVAGVLEVVRHRDLDEIVDREITRWGGNEQTQWVGLDGNAANFDALRDIGGIVTADIDAVHRAARPIRAGQIFINEWYAGGVETPFDGYGKSGYGREKGREALWNYVQTKNIAYRTR